MGFFSGITKTLTGGATSKSSSENLSGLLALPDYATGPYKNLLKEAQNLVGGGRGAQLFTPIGLTAGEQQAQSLTQLPNSEEGVQSLISRFMNPYMQSAYDTINREAEGNYSLSKQALNNAGQFGSNREILGAVNADEARLRAIGEAQRTGFNSALGTGLAQNQQTIENLMNMGGVEREIGLAGSRAPLDALLAFAQILGTLPSTAKGTSSSKSDSVGGFLPGLSGSGAK